MITKIAACFNEGDPVPGWLLYYDPDSRESNPGDFTFGGRVVVLETDENYFLVLDGPGVVLRIGETSKDMDIGASSKRVNILWAGMTFEIEPGAGRSFVRP